MSECSVGNQAVLGKDWVCFDVEKENGGGR